MRPYDLRSRAAAREPAPHIQRGLSSTARRRDWLGNERAMALNQGASFARRIVATISRPQALCILRGQVCRKRGWGLIRRAGPAWESINSERRLREAFCATSQDRHPQRLTTEALRRWFRR